MDGTPCSKCNEPDKKATVRCLDCKEFFCEGCHASHDSWTSMKKHKVLVIKDLCPEWKQTGQFTTTPHLLHPYAIAVHSDGDVVVTNGGYKKAVIYNRENAPKHFLGLDVESRNPAFEASLLGVAVTPDKRFVFPAKKNLVFYSSNGVQLEKARDAGGLASDPNAIAVDAKGVIIVSSTKRIQPSTGPRRYNPSDDHRKEVIFLFHSDGRYRSEINMSSKIGPKNLAVTLNNEIIMSSMDSLTVNDYNGGNWRFFPQPPGVASWISGPVCCSKQGEVYVINYGDTFAVYKYLVNGCLYLGCAVKGLHNPTGIAISDDGKKLYITEGYLNLVKIFECP